MASGYTARRWEKIRELLYITRVFFLLLAHEFCVRWMKNRHRSLPICLVTLTCRPTLDVTVWNRESRLLFLAASFPIVFSPDALLAGEAIGEAASLLRRTPSLCIASPSLIRLLGVFYHCQSSGGMCVRRPPWRGAAAGPSVQVPAARLRLPCQFWSPIFFICCCWLLFLSVYLIWRLLVCFTSSLHSVYLIFFCQSKFKKLGDVSGQSLSNCCILYVSFCSKLFIDGCSVLYNELVTSNYM